MPKDDKHEFDLLVAQLHKEGAKPTDDYIFSGATTIEIDGVDILIKEAIAMRKKGGSIREQRAIPASAKYALVPVFRLHSYQCKRDTRRSKN